MIDGAGQTVLQLVDGFASHGAAPALSGVDGAAVMSHAELAGFVRGTATELAQAGIGRGDVVMLAVADGPAALPALLAIATVATVLPVPPMDQEAEYEFLLDYLDVAAVMLDDRPNAALVRIATRRCLTTVRIVQDSADGTFRTVVERPRAPRLREEPRLDDHAIVGLTSGTTAAPKIVAVSHAAVHAQARCFADLMGLTADDRSLCVMPVAHLHSFFRSSLPVLIRGGSVIWAPGLDERRVLDWIDTLAPTFATGTPTHFRRMASRAVETGWTPGRSRLRLIAMGSDRVTAEDIERVRDVFGVKVAQFYGMTETSPTIAATPLTGDVPQGAVGRVTPDWQVACLDAAGQPVAVGEIGEIAVRGGFVNPLIGPTNEGRDRTDPTGRFLTGDLGRLDAAGFLHVVGRVDDRITRGGEKIAPQSVEDVIVALDAVSEAVVFGVPDPVAGERVIAAVVPAYPDSVTEADILDHLAKRLQRQMLPERVLLVDRLPETRSGKVSRRSLALHFSAKLSALPARSRPEVAGTAPDGLAPQLLEIFRRRLEDPDLGADEDFFEAGGDSLTALETLMEIEGQFGVSLAPAAFTIAGTAARVVAAVLQAQAQPSGARVVESQAGDPGTAVIVGHGLGGEAGYAPNLSRAMRSDQTVAALHARPADPATAEPRTLPEMAEDYASLLCREYPQGRMVTGGFSLGAHVSLAVANRLASVGRDSPLVFVLDDEADLDRRLFGARKSTPVERTAEALNKWALDASPAEPFPGRILYFRADENAGVYRSDPTAGWGEIALGGVQTVDVSGNHHALVRKSTLDGIGPILQQAIDSADLASAPPPGIDEERRLRFAARLAARDGRLHEEIALCRRLIADFTDQPHWLHGNLAEALFQAGDTADALEAMNRAIRSDPWPLASDVRFAPFIAARRLKGQIEAMLHRADSVLCDHPSVFHYLAMLQTRLGRESEAERFYRLGLAEAPQHLKLNFGLAATLLRKDRFAEAAGIYRTIVEQCPEIPMAHVQLGQSLIGAGDPGGAEDALGEALQRWPRHLHLKLTLANAARLSGKLREAETVCREAMEIAPRSPEPQKLLAEILSSKDRPDRVDIGANPAGSP